jgi:hypothetical protein
MKLNKINVEAYEEILKDLYLFIKINPASLERLFDYTPLTEREGMTKYDNPSLYSDMFDYAEAQGVIDRHSEKSKMYNPFSNVPDTYGLYSGENTHYKIKVNKHKLDEELAAIENSPYNDKQNVVEAKILLNENELVIESEYGTQNIHSFRTGSPLREFLNYILNSKPEEQVKLTDIKRRGINASDTFSEMLRKSGVNETVKKYFFPSCTANTVVARPRVMIGRTDWNVIASSLTK